MAKKLNDRHASDFLKSYSSKILHLFVDAVRGDNIKAQKVSDSILINSLPDLLKHMQDKLGYQSSVDSNPKIEAIAKEHTLQRARLNYCKLGDVLREYHQLRKIIFEVLRGEGEITPKESDIINDVIDRCVTLAGHHYSEVSGNRLDESQKLFRLLVERTTEYAIFMLSPEGIIQTWNEGAERIKGYKAEEIIGTHFSIFYPPEAIRKDHPEYELKFAIENGSFEEEGIRIRKDGSQFWANVVITALFGEDHQLKGFSKVTRDITERRRVDEKLKEAIKARDDFLSIASHELKTPLTSLRLQIQMRKRSLTKGELSSFSPERLEKMIEADNRQLDRISRLIDDMLDISRMNTGKLTMRPEHFDLTALAEEVLSRYQDQFEATGTKVNLKSSEKVEGTWDRYRIEQAIANLLTNAMKYGAGKPVEISVRSEGPSAKLTVRDKGMGIAKDNQDRIFDQFERAVPAKEISGLGLGLYITRQIIEMHGGSIRVESEVGEGSAFIVDLPIDSTPENNL